MDYILSVKQKKLLARFSKFETALVFDYDGTLAPLVSDPLAAVLSQSTRKLLGKLCRAYPCAILSGRGLADVKSRVKGLAFHSVVGNHGMEFSDSSKTKGISKKVATWSKMFCDALERGDIDARGLELEDKNMSLSIHYRESPAHKKVAKEILTVFKKTPGLRIVSGKFVFNLLPNIKKNKGTAIAELREILSCDHIIYLGDDVTDEDVFSLKNKTKLLDIRVGRSTKSKARYFLRNQTEMNSFLKCLLDLRSAP